MQSFSSRSLLRSLVGSTAVVAAVAVGAVATASPPTTVGELSGELHVSAAASLTNVYTQFEADFEALHPDVDVILNFGSSSDLVTQITEGAPADVFASADLNNMAKLVDAELISGEPAVFATNRLAIAVEAGNPQGITGLDDLAERSDLIVVTCDPEVPIGRYTLQVLEAAGVTVEFDSFEENVRGITGKIEIGEADAGIVYATDIAALEKLEAVEIPVEFNLIAVYPIAVTAESTNPTAATAFVEYVLGDEAQALFAAAGFGSPADAPAPVETTVPAGSIPETTAAAA